MNYHQTPNLILFSRGNRMDARLFRDIPYLPSSGASDLMGGHVARP